MGPVYGPGAGGGCLYLKRLADVDMKALKELVAAAVRDLKQKRS